MNRFLRALTRDGEDSIWEVAAIAGVVGIVLWCIIWAFLRLP